MFDSASFSQAAFDPDSFQFPDYEPAAGPALLVFGLRIPYGIVPSYGWLDRK